MKQCKSKNVLLQHASVQLHAYRLHLFFVFSCLQNSQPSFWWDHQFRQAHAAGYLLFAVTLISVPASPKSMLNACSVCVCVYISEGLGKHDTLTASLECCVFLS